jgi:hypothetical protein
VSYENGLLDVKADDSSLNQILREISRLTGMRIVGGVADQRVFGNYGPAAPATVLQTLLDGTGTNMLLKGNVAAAPLELVLTPRTGGPTPPGPSSSSFDATESEPVVGAAAPAPATSVQPGAPSPPSGVAGTGSTAPPAGNAPNNGTPSTQVPPSMPQPFNNVNGNPANVSPTAATLPVINSVPSDSLPTPSTAPAATGIVDAPNPPPAGSTTAGFTGQTPPDYNPNVPAGGNAPAGTAGANTAQPAGAATPQQIYEQLRALQQQRQTQGNMPATPSGQTPQTTAPNPQGNTPPQR